jgi:hypothetical protein
MTLSYLICLCLVYSALLIHSDFHYDVMKLPESTLVHISTTSDYYASFDPVDLLSYYTEVMRKKQVNKLKSNSTSCYSANFNQILPFLSNLSQIIEIFCWAERYSWCQGYFRPFPVYSIHNFKTSTGQFKLAVPHVQSIT